MATNALNVIINGDPTGLLGAFATSGSAGDAWEQKIKTVTKSASFAMGAGFVAIGAAAFKVGSDFDEAFDKIRTNTGATGDKLNGLQSDFKAVVGSVPASFEDAGNAVSGLSQKLGLTGEPLRNLSGQILDLSRITKTDLTGNIAAVSDVFRNFGVSAEDQGGKLDELFRASQASGVSVADLSRTMSDSGVVLRAVGFDFTQSAALIGTLGKAGIDASDVMPALGKSLATAAKDGKSAQDVFKQTFDAINAAPDATTAAGIAMDTFGAKGGPKLAAAIREGKLSLADMMNTVSNGSDTITGAAKDTADFQEKFELLKNKAFLALEPIATKIFGIIGDGMGFITDHANIAIPLILGLAGAFTAWKIATMAAKVATEIATIAQWAMNAALDANPIGLVIIAIAALAAAVYVVWTKWDTIWNWIMHHKALAGVIAVLFPIIGIIVAIVGAIKYLMANWQWIWADIQKVIAVVWSYIEPVWNAIVDFVMNTMVPAFITIAGIAVEVFQAIAKAVLWAWNNIIQPVWNAIYWYITNILIPGYVLLWNIVSTAFGVIVDVISWAWNNIIQPIWSAIEWYITNVLIPAFTIIWNVVSTAFSVISDVISWAWNNIIQPIWSAIEWYITNVLIPVFETIWNVVSTAFGIIVSVIGDAWGFISGIFDSIKGGVQGVIDFFLGIPGAIAGIGSGIANAIFDGFKSAWNGVADFINDLIPNDIGFGPVSIDLPDNPIPKFHSGGVFQAPSPGGEGLALLRDGERILTPSQMTASSNYPAAASDGRPIVVNVTNPAASPYQIGREVLWTLKVAG
ncbi:COG5412 Phage-related protein [uncultured Caudovirales phage]|uniref:COG5412 Phage-related protein n=1 Tax=uncultured Caudovirales phage TaxID=2100421 RepID=A0A6J7WRB6_9CAUD|nr:COG5412 Phage-related protein [uncultured Caudovirales phage]